MTRHLTTVPLKHRNMDEAFRVASSLELAFGVGNVEIDTSFHKVGVIDADKTKFRNALPGDYYHQHIALEPIN